ncbi:MAG: hypothetical protein ACJART_002260 [Maribacter sp.]|jgi:hypothetical protein
MKPLLLFLGFTVLLSCTSVNEEKLDLLNGYWEIDRVEFPNGGEKEYRMSTDVDFIQLEGLKGFRKKMKPRFDGNFETSDDAEPFRIKVSEEIYSIVYKNNLSEWSETLTAISKDNFSIKNEDGILYHYKRFEPISISP